ncbi:hypothetical protein [Pseudohoeflea coraliihabitans]|uniref:Uncharacterized protein n=1 Tax=Pseudohoeflea coraliihabitans TaxID=2860393 RepID=A0ABS6WJJ5_9HYPH|nr:hypothetical protein [Pseudohoeflea sp. DP4N28-3]MBW3096025.1 hypothetical protein [Pseudohoeflea sp. DP4N28-3]
MDNLEVKETLNDARCGLYFLAGADRSRSGRRTEIITIHAVDDALTREQRAFITETFAATHPNHELRLRFHSNRQLHAPQSLEAFAERFHHDKILADPTGSFSRVSKLLSLARLIRARLGDAIDRILWQPDIAALTLIMPSAGSAASQRAGIEGVHALIESSVCEDLRKALRSVRVSSSVPSTRYTPVDNQSMQRSAGRGLAALVARVSGLVALIGLGSLTAAQAGAQPSADDTATGLPGVTGLVGLTTLGENSYGLRNRYQAVGGLRLYFGATGVVLASALTPGRDIDLEEAAIGRPEAEDETESGLPMPTHVVYGAG